MYLTLLFFLLVGYTGGYRNVCFHRDLAQPDSGATRLLPLDIDLEVCTHLVFSVERLEDLTAKQRRTEYISPSQQLYSDIHILKDRNPVIKILVAVGGLLDGPHRFAQIAETVTSRSTFAANVASFLRKKDLDGLHLDWEYPLSASKSTAGFKVKFVLLLKAISTEFDKDAYASQRARFILATSVPAMKVAIDNGYDVPNIVKYTDFISLKTINFHTALDKKVGLNSPLYAHSSEEGDAKFLNLDWVVRYYLSLGASRNHINVGIPTYAQMFTLQDKKKHQIGSPSLPKTFADGIIGFAEVCGFIQEDVLIKDVPSQKGRYMVEDSLWVSYEDVLSVMDKSCYTKNNSLGGTTFWSLSLDDFEGSVCKLGKYPLITTAYNSYMFLTMEECNTRNPDVFMKVPQPPELQGNEHDASQTSVPGMRIVCYYMTWARFRSGKGQFNPENIDPNLCTHIIIAYAKIDGLHLAPFHEDDDSTPWKEGLYNRVTRLKQINPSLKVLLSVGGPNVGAVPFIPLTKSYYTRSTFASNVVSFLRQRDFDGLDVDWQYPDNAYRQHFIFVMQHLKSKFDSEARSSGKPRLLLTAVLPASKSRIDNGYDVLKLIMNTDFISLMTYDFHGSWDGFVGVSSPLYVQPRETGDARYLNVDAIAKYYESRHAPKYEINIGIATYGRSFKLQNPQVYALGSPCTDASHAGPITGRKGILAYYEICDIISSGGVLEDDPLVRSRYVVKGDQWISFEDTRSITEKACYAKKSGYGGVMIWSIDEDDFSGASCKQGKYPLLSAVFNESLVDVFENCGSTTYGQEVTGSSGSQLLHTEELSLSSNLAQYYVLLLCTLHAEPTGTLLWRITLGVLLHPSITYLFI